MAGINADMLLRKHGAYIDCTKAAEYIGCCAATVRRMMGDGRIEYVSQSNSGRRKVKTAGLVRFLKENAGFAWDGRSNKRKETACGDQC